MGRSLRKASSRHFQVVWECESRKVDRRRLDPHELMHVYLQRLEDVYADYASVLGAAESEFETPMTLLVWETVEDQVKAARELCAMSGAASYDGGGVVQRLGLDPRTSLRWNEQEQREDADFHRLVVHHAAHMLLALQKPTGNLGALGSGWADEGLAHWFEQRRFETCTVFCGLVVPPDQNPGLGQWRKHLRKLVVDEKEPQAGAVMLLDTAQLSLDQHVAAYAYVDFLVAKDPALFGNVCRRLRTKLPARDALVEFFGLTLDAFQAQWRAWILAEYGPR